MIAMNATRKHKQAGHTGEFNDCDIEECRHQRYGLDFDPDSYLDRYYKNFRGEDAEQKAKEFAQKEVNKGKTAFGVVVVYKQVVDWYVEEDGIGEWKTVSEREEFTAELDEE